MRDPLSKKITGIAPSGIRKFFDIVSEMPDAISLGVGEPDFDTPWRVREEGIYTLEKGRTFYTSNAGLKELRQEISNCDLLLLKQFRRKFFRRHPKLLNVREHIKCSKWLKATKPHFFKRMHKITSSLIICCAHLLDLIITVLQSLDCCILTVCRCAQNCVLMDFHHLLHDDLRSAYVPQSPSRHGKTF